MDRDFTHTTFGKTGIKVHRLGLASSYWPGKKAVHTALDHGMNFFFCYGFDFQMTGPLRELMKSNREKFIVATGGYNLFWFTPNLRRSLEKRLRKLKTDYIDVFLFLGVLSEKDFPQRFREEMVRFREEGKVRFIGISTHNRKFAGRLCEEGALDVIMMRYNAAHRGAEQDIFPYVEKHNPGIINYTATRWTFLLRRPRKWPKHGRIPTAGQCYRFVLSNPNVHVCLTAPRSVKQLKENLDALEQGPLDSEEMKFMHEFGDAVRHTRKWFM
jgi:aryl-alcohol dehydrogenase-like predicted oxidoreductase